MNPAYALALVSALCYGSADFFGGLASRRASAIAVVLLSQFAGLLALVALLPVLPPASATSGDLVWGGAAGLAGGVGVGLLYRALAVGTMAVVAPTTAVCAVVVPVAAGILLGDRPGAGVSTGIGLALLSIVLVSRTPAVPGDGTRGAAARGLLLAVASGVAIGLFFVAVARTGPDAGLLPLVAARAASIALFGVAAWIGRPPLRGLPARTRTLIVVAGVLDMLANVLYLLASRRGALAVVVTLASLYPASTVVLARVVLGERLGRVQIAGVAAALTAIALIVGADV